MTCIFYKDFRKYHTPPKKKSNIYFMNAYNSLITLKHIFAPPNNLTKTATRKNAMSHLNFKKEWPNYTPVATFLVVKDIRSRKFYNDISCNGQISFKEKYTLLPTPDHKEKTKRCDICFWLPR